MPVLPKVFVHSRPLQTLAPALEALLPYSLPVLRRIQFHLQTPHRVVLSTLDPSQTKQSSSTVTTDKATVTGAAGDSPEGEVATSSPPPFAVLYIDRSRYPETESWIFSTADSSSSARGPHLAAISEPLHHGAATSSWSSADEETRAHLLAIVAYASQHYRDSPSPQDTKSSPADSSAMVVGSVHQATLRLLLGKDRYDVREPGKEYGWPGTMDGNCSAKGNRSSGGALRGHTIPWIKYLYPPLKSGDSSRIEKSESNSSVPNTSDAPDNLQWTTELGEADYALVEGSSHIPHKARTLAVCPAKALRDAAGILQAWVFTKPDGSFGALHVQPDHRGGGVARALVNGLRDGAATATATAAHYEHGEHDERAGSDDDKNVVAFEGMSPQTAWCHCDTGEDNFAAQAVLSKTGGIPSWRCYWGFLDLDAVLDEVRDYEERE